MKSSYNKDKPFSKEKYKHKKSDPKAALNKYTDLIFYFCSIVSTTYSD